MKRIPLRNRAGETIAHALVDDADYAWAMQWRWSLGSHGYARRGDSEGRAYLMHRELLGLRAGDKREGDHRNGDPLDNQRSNLRIATSGQNKQNRHHVAGRSGRRGVSLHSSGLWRGRVEIDGHVHLVGYFSSVDEADAAVSRFRRERMPYAEEAK